MGYCDDTLWDQNEDECRRFIGRLRAAREDIVSFVSNLLGWTSKGIYCGWLKGSFNIGYIIKYAGPTEEDDDEVEYNNDDGNNPQSVFIRFPLPGRTYSPWAAEKVKNEVFVLEYLREHTTIPVPRVHSWGSAEESPRQLGPFILMDYMEGVCLDDLLKKPTERESDMLILDPAIDQRTLRVVFSQIADYMYQLSQLRLPAIGTVTRNNNSSSSPTTTLSSFGNQWAITTRPMTYDMNELVTVTGFPADEFSSGPFNSTENYFTQRANEMMTHVRTQRNICETAEEARQKLTARQRLRQLIPKYILGNATTKANGDNCDNERLGFRLFSDDFGPFNMLADPSTLKITAVLDLEFTNAMPAQYIYDVPSWLLLASPHCWLEQDDKAGFEELFVPLMNLFLDELERVEARNAEPLDDGSGSSSSSSSSSSKRGEGGEDEPPNRHYLSTGMRESWDSGRFWFNYAMRTSIDADVVYWKALHDRVGEEYVKENEAEVEAFVATKLKQFDSYKRERGRRRSKSG
ncbi:hypothetical protein BGZ63DRAFT_379977 [Mariannaea sp. PMI_226]|nr:hypothetical protein BGZ63DRAFT_379977 [Mariannaea sp. PMI_226]